MLARLQDLLLVVWILVGKSKRGMSECIERPSIHVGPQTGDTSLVPTWTARSAIGLRQTELAAETRQELGNEDQLSRHP
jgi:hypothetical protein